MLILSYSSGYNPTIYATDCIKQVIEQHQTVTLTAYTNYPSETDGDPNITADGSRVKKGIIAVSRDLQKRGWGFGDIVMIDGVGTFTIRDVMHPKWKNRLDIYMDDRSEALEFGKKTNVKAFLLAKGKS